MYQGPRAVKARQNLQRESLQLSQVCYNFQGQNVFQE